MYVTDGKYELKFFRQANKSGSRVDTVAVARLNKKLGKNGWFKVTEVHFNPKDGKTTQPPVFNKSVGQYLALLRALSVLNVNGERSRNLQDRFLEKLDNPLPSWVEQLI